MINEFIILRTYRIGTSLKSGSNIAIYVNKLTVFIP